MFAQNSVCGSRSMFTGRRSRCVGAAAVVVLAGGSCAFGQWDAVADYSITNGNPNGVWSYGETPTLGGLFTGWNNNGNVVGLDYWARGAPGSGLLNPDVAKNVTGSTVFYGTSVEVHPGQLTMHPGALGEFSVIRFTAPTSGFYSFSATFIGEDFLGPTTSDVNLLVNSSPVFSSPLTGFHTTVSTGLFGASLLAGDTVDVAVGWGVNGNYNADTTAVVFSVVPTPGGAALLGLGGIVAARRRRV